MMPAWEKVSFGPPAIRKKGRIMDFGLTAKKKGEKGLKTPFAGFFGRFSKFWAIYPLSSR